MNRRTKQEESPAAPSLLQIMGLKVEAHKRASLERYELFTFILHHLLNAALGEAGRKDVQTIMNFFAHGAKKCHAG